VAIPKAQTRGQNYNKKNSLGGVANSEKENSDGECRQAKQNIGEQRI
jgi:hypothetical protein